MNMRKLKLSLDELQVDSFHATAPEARGGTVEANSWTQYADESCFESCNGNCSGSCGGGCGTNTAWQSCYGSCQNTCGCPPNTDYTACNCETWETCPNATVCA
jgi:hypothetical protein